MVEAGVVKMTGSGGVEGPVNWLLRSLIQSPPLLFRSLGNRALFDGKGEEVSIDCTLWQDADVVYGNVGGR